MTEVALLLDEIDAGNVRMGTLVRACRAASVDPWQARDLLIVEDLAGLAELFA